MEKLFEEKYRVKLEEWKIEVERKLREDALAKSRAVLKGKLAEQLAPMFAIFGYNPSDARFISDPVDYIIGYTAVRERIEDLKEIIIGEPGPTKYDFEMGGYLDLS